MTLITVWSHWKKINIIKYFFLYLMGKQINFFFKILQVSTSLFSNQWCTKQNYTHIYACVSQLSTNIPIELIKYLLIWDFTVDTYNNEILTFTTLKSYKIWDNKWWINIYFLWRTITSEKTQNALILSARGSTDVKFRCLKAVPALKEFKKNYNGSRPIT